MLPYTFEIMTGRCISQISARIALNLPYFGSEAVSYRVKFWWSHTGEYIRKLSDLRHRSKKESQYQNASRRLSSTWITPTPPQSVTVCDIEQKAAQTGGGGLVASLSNNLRELVQQPTYNSVDVSEDAGSRLGLGLDKCSLNTVVWEQVLLQPDPTKDLRTIARRSLVSLPDGSPAEPDLIWMRQMITGCHLDGSPAEQQYLFCSPPADNWRWVELSDKALINHVFQVARPSGEDRAMKLKAAASRRRRPTHAAIGNRGKRGRGHTVPSLRGVGPLLRRARHT